MGAKKLGGRRTEALMTVGSSQGRSPMSRELDCGVSVVCAPKQSLRALATPESAFWMTKAGVTH